MRHQDSLVESNPLELNKRISTLNRSGRPRLSATIRFCPQPQSIISLRLTEENKLNEKYQNDVKEEAFNNSMENESNNEEYTNILISDTDDNYEVKLKKGSEYNSTILLSSDIYSENGSDHKDNLKMASDYMVLF